MIDKEDDTEDEGDERQGDEDCVKDHIDFVGVQEAVEDSLKAPPKDQTTGQDNEDEGCGVILPDVSFLEENEDENTETQKLQIEFYIEINKKYLQQ